MFLPCPGLTILFVFLNFCGLNIIFESSLSPANFYGDIPPNGTVNSPPKVPTMSNVFKYVYFTGASYYSKQVLENWKCDYCNKTGITASNIKVFTNDTFNTLVIVAKDKSVNTIIIVFRGTINVENCLQDMAQLLVCPYFNLCDDNIKVHKGFLLATLSLYNQVVSAIRSFASGGQISVVLVGHSLGGAMATMTLFLLQRESFPVTCTFSLYTYGQPRTGNKEFVDYINGLNIEAARVVSKLDIVPHMVPVRCGFLHHQNEIFIYNGSVTVCSNRTYEDPLCSNYYYPCYSVNDHLNYFDVYYATGPAENPALFLLQMI